MNTPNTDPHALPKTYPDRRTAAAALGLTPRQLGTLAGKGAPLPEDGDIAAAPLVAWLWANRGMCPLPADDERERKLRLQRMELQNLKLSERHLDEAQRLVSRRLARAQEGLRQRLSGPGLPPLLAAAQGTPSDAGPRLVRLIMDEAAAAIDEALQ